MSKASKPVFINPLAIVVKNSTVEVKIKEQSTGLVLELRPSSDPVVKSLEKTHRKDSFRARKEGSDPMEYAIEHTEDRLNDQVVAHVAGWSWRDGVAPELAKLGHSEKQLREFLAAVPFGDAIREAVFSHLRDDTNFFEMPAAS